MTAPSTRRHRCPPTAIKAYNGKAGIYEQVVQKRGQPLREGFTIVKVRAVSQLGDWISQTRMHALNFEHAYLP